MYDLPQQPPDGEVILPIEVGEQDNKITQDGVTFEVLERPTPPQTKLEEKDLYTLAHFLRAKYSKGFTWNELPSIMNEVVSFIGPNPEMSLKEKRLSAIETIHYLLVSMDSLYLPEKATEAFFEQLIPPFFHLALSFPNDRTLINPSRSEPLTETVLSEYAKQLSEHFDEGMSWKNLANATHHAMTYILSYVDLNREEQRDGAFAIMERILSQTDSSRLPSHYDGKLFLLFLKSFIAVQLPSTQGASE
ncbi:MAG: hypothetical protein KFB93_06575 [Simkaniaceae bacterium]|nr:MAG: hypothetical protein KFB93_06575 [Simkaniaceae bacterium]